MNYNKLKEFKFWPTVDKVLMTRPFDGKRRPSLYPSEASVVATDPQTGFKQIIGACQRKPWYRIMGIKPSNPPTERSMWIFEFGKELENHITELTKRARIWNNNSVKFFDPALNVSGEMDIIVEPFGDGVIFVECKTSYGYYAEREHFDHWVGRGSKKVLVKGKPKDAHLLQLALYLFYHKDDERVLGGKLVYLLRDNMNRTEFDMTIEPEQVGVTETGTPVYKHRVFVNGEADKRFYMEDVLDNYKQLGAKIMVSFNELRAGKTVAELVPPERSYDLVYSDEKIEAEYKKGNIKDSDYEAWTKDNTKRPGDFNCSYCDFKDYCWTQAAIQEHLGGKTGKRTIKKRVDTVTKPKLQEVEYAAASSPAA